MKTRPLVLIAASLVIVAVAGWFVTRPAQVATVKVIEAPLVQMLVFSGRVATQTRVELGSLITGRVGQVLLREGERASAGQILAQLESADLSAQLEQANANVQLARAKIGALRELAQPTTQAGLAQANANLESARKEELRNRELVSKGFVSQARLDEAVRAVAVAAAQVDSARASVRANSNQGNELVQAQLRVKEAEGALALANARLAQTRIVAPSAGTVISRAADPGQIVQPGKVLFVFAPDGASQLIGQADEKFLALLAKGQSARVVVDAYPAQAFDATLASIAPEVDAQRGTVEVKFAVTAPPAFLREDMTLSLQVLVGRKERALTLPASAVLGAASAASVRLVSDGRVVESAVKIGLRTTERVEVLEGLKVGQAVLAAPLSSAPGSRASARSTEP